MASKSFIVGFDEAGRGPLAGPVAAGAVILPPDFPLDILNDSKKISEKKRLAAEKIIKEKACWGIGLVDHNTIDRINILQASLLAMKIALDNLMERFPKWLEDNKNIFGDLIVESCTFSGIADGNQLPPIDIPCKAVVQGDKKIPEVMAASILAKTCRDKIMIDMDKKYPQYGYSHHKGYPTPEHKAICHEIGPSPIQRLSFKY